MKPDRRTLFGAIVIALSLLLVAGGGLALAQGSGSAPVNDADAEDSITENNVSLSEEDAIDIATAEANGSVEEVELESEDGTPVYEVEIVASDGGKTEVTVHADNGTVLELESEDEDDESEEEDEDETEDE